MKAKLGCCVLFFPLSVFAAGSIASFVDKDNEYWITDPTLFSLDKSSLPINCSSYADASIANNPNGVLAFQQNTSTGQRFIVRFPKNGSLWQSVPNLKNVDIFTPYTNYSVNGNQFSYTLSVPRDIKLIQAFVYDQKNKFKRYVTEYKGPPANQADVFAHNEGIKDAKKKGLPGVLEIKCIGNPNDF